MSLKNKILQILKEEENSENLFKPKHLTSRPDLRNKNVKIFEKVVIELKKHFEENFITSKIRDTSELFGEDSGIDLIITFKNLPGYRFIFALEGDKLSVYLSPSKEINSTSWSTPMYKIVHTIAKINIDINNFVKQIVEVILKYYREYAPGEVNENKSFFKPRRMSFRPKYSSHELQILLKTEEKLRKYLQHHNESFKIEVEFDAREEKDCLTVRFRKYDYPFFFYLKNNQLEVYIKDLGHEFFLLNEKDKSSEIFDITLEYYKQIVD